MATKKEDHARSLAQLRGALLLGKTVNEIAAEVGCSKSAAYARLKALTGELEADRTGQLIEVPIRTGKRGPRAVKFKLVPFEPRDANGAPTP